MAKALRAVAVVAAVVALTFAIPGVGTAIGASIGVAISAGTAATIAAVASAVSAVAAAGAGMLQKPPDMKGSVNEVVIGANMPVPYAIGRTYVGGMKVYDDSAPGPNGHPNKDRTQIMVVTHAGPVDSFEGFYADYTLTKPASGGLIAGIPSGYYGADGGYMFLNSRLGLRPDTALTAYSGRSAFTNWGASAKLSGMACYSVTMEFDEEGERYAGGIPAYGVVGKWVKIYDPRLDSTYPGGSGAQRWDDESTWTWSENPGLHALTYARGRFMGPNNTKVVGPGIPKQFIDIAAFVELANVSDANGWKCGGAIYEGPGVSRWDNLKRILAAASAEPCWVGGLLTCRFQSPKVALATLTPVDLAEGDVEVQAMPSWKDRINTVVPRYRSEQHRWEYVQADAVTEPTYLTEDGEMKTDEVQYDLCQDVNQAAQLAAYDLVKRREFGPIKLRVKPAWMGFRPGEAIEVDLPEAGMANQLAVITSRSVDPSTGAVDLTLQSETTAKHSWALTRTGVAPPTPSIAAPETIDAAVQNLTTTTSDLIQLILTSSVANLSFSVNASGVATVSDHLRIYSDKAPVTVTGGTVAAPAGVVAGDIVAVYYGDPNRVGGAVVYASIKLAAGDELPKPDIANPDLHMVGWATVPGSGTVTGGSAIGSSNPAVGVGGGGGGWRTQTP